MGKLLLIALLPMWAVVLLPELFRRRPLANRDSIAAFNQRLAVLERNSSGRSEYTNVLPFKASEPSSAVGPVRRRPDPTPVTRHSVASQRPTGPSPEVRRRRAEVLMVLGVAFLLSMAGAIALGGVMIILNVVIDVAAIAYVVALVDVSRRERLNQRVAPLHQPSVRVRPAGRTVARPAVQPRRAIAN